MRLNIIGRESSSTFVPGLAGPQSFKLSDYLHPSQMMDIIGGLQVSYNTLSGCGNVGLLAITTRDNNPDHLIGYASPATSGTNRLVSISMTTSKVSSQNSQFITLL